MRCLRSLLAAVALCASIAGTQTAAPTNVQRGYSTSTSILADSLLDLGRLGWLLDRNTLKTGMIFDRYKPR
jgi:hypothetical protein